MDTLLLIELLSVYGDISMGVECTTLRKQNLRLMFQNVLFFL